MLTNGSALNLSGSVFTGNLTVDANSSIAGSGLAPVVTINDTLTNYGTINLVNASLNVNHMASNSGIMNLTNSSLWTGGGFTNNAGGTLNANYQTVLNTSVVNNGTMSLDSAANTPNGYSGSPAITLVQGVTNNGTLSMLGTIVSDGDINNNSGGSIQIGTGSRATSVSGGDWLNAGNLSIASGSALLSGGSFDNSGNVTMTAGDLQFDSFTNDIGGMLSGTGTINIGAGVGTFDNYGTLAPGGIGTVGSLDITGGFSQSSTGSLLIDIASSTSYDHLNINGDQFVSLDGTLQTSLLGGYVPTLGQSFQPFGSTTEVSGVFRHVLGNAVNDGGSLEMVKSFTTDSGIFLTMSGSENLSFSGGDGSWGNISNWRSSYFPTAIDNVTVSGSALQHTSSDGTDIVNNLTVAASGSLNQFGGTISAANLVSAGTLSVSSGTLQVGNLTSTGLLSLGYIEGEGTANLDLSGNATSNSLALERGGHIIGSSASQLTVTGDFEQSTGSSINSSGGVVVNQTSGNLNVGNITAANLTLTANDGGISQFDALHVTGQLRTNSSLGTMLDNGDNQIAAYTGANSGMGVIILVNNLNTADTSVVHINGITNAGNGIVVNNTGAMATTGAISGSTVSLSTHSPLTIGSAGVVASTGGNITLFAGNSMSVNANISTSAPGTALFTVVNGTIAYAPGVSITDANGTRIPAAVAAQTLVAPAVTSAVAPTVNTVIDAISANPSNVINVVTPSPSVTNTTSATTTETMTTGGDAGTFGGSDTTDASAGKTSGNSASAKAAKNFCS